MRLAHALAMLNTKYRAYSIFPRYIATAALCLSLVACASYPVIPAPEVDRRLDEVKSDLGAYYGSSVRWGGTIVSVENEEQFAWIEVLERKLDRYGYPDPYSQSDGRFFIKEPSVLDPKVYTEGRRITVLGTLTGSVETKIGDAPYQYPIVEAQEHHLWESERRYTYYPRHYYRYPFYYYPYDYYYPHNYHYYHPFFYGHGHHRRRHYRW